MNKKNYLFLGLLLTLAGCHKTPDNDGLQAHEQRALDILESYMEKEVSH